MLRVSVFGFAEHEIFVVVLAVSGEEEGHGLERGRREADFGDGRDGGGERGWLFVDFGRETGLACVAHGSLIRGLRVYIVFAIVLYRIGDWAFF